MTDEQISAVQKQLTKLQDDVDLVKKALLGDGTLGPGARGIIANTLTMMDDLYKNGSGLKNRVQLLEETKIKTLGWIGGFSFLAGGAWLLIKELIGVIHK